MFRPFRKDLLITGVIAGIANSSMNANEFYQNNQLDWEGMTEPQKPQLRDIFVNANFGPTLNMQLFDR